MQTNISKSPEERLSRMFALIGQPVRIQILFVIRQQKACVCHLEAVLGLRQASISQHLMSLRKAGLVETDRDGRHIYYRLTAPQVIELLEQAARIAGLSPEDFRRLSIHPVPNCSCPQCNPGIDQYLVCKNKPPS